MPIHFVVNRGILLIVVWCYVFCMPILQHNHHCQKDCIPTLPREMPTWSCTSVNSTGSSLHCTDAMSGCPLRCQELLPAITTCPIVHPPCHAMHRCCHCHPRCQSHLRGQRETIPHRSWSIHMQGVLCPCGQRCGASNAAAAAVILVVLVDVVPPGETTERQYPCCHPQHWSTP